MSLLGFKFEHDTRYKENISLGRVFVFFKVLTSLFDWCQSAVNYDASNMLFSEAAYS